VLFKVQSAAVYGIDAYLVEVEVDVGSGRMGEFNVVGLPDAAVKESRERIKAALKNCGFDFPSPQGVTINLAPADVRKEGSGFDLPMAMGLLGCQGMFSGKPLTDWAARECFPASRSPTSFFSENFRSMEACGRFAGRFRRRLKPASAA